MKIAGDGIHFNGLPELKKFADDFSMNGLIRLSEPVKDNQGKILVKENVNIKESVIQKLESMEGQYVPNFSVSITGDLIRQIRIYLAKLITDRLDQISNSFIAELYKNTMHNYAGYINGAFLSKNLALTAFKLSMNHPSYFHYISDLGLISLGIIIQNAYRIRFVNRYAFQAGFTCDLSMLGTEVWKSFLRDETAKYRFASESAAISERLGLTPEVVEAVRDHIVSVKTLLKDYVSPFDLSTETVSGAELLSDILEGEEEMPETGKVDERAKLMVSEALRIAKFINDVTKLITDREHFAEELIYMLAYNMSLGYFHKDMINPVLRHFRQYEKNVKQMIRIAEIEKECLYPPSAWAYPKPRASQVLCKNRVYGCPLMEQGWDINILGEQEAFGWIGTSLPSGAYPKCSLENRLNEVEWEMHARSSPQKKV
jgi:hypothetical protein